MDTVSKLLIAAIPEIIRQIGEWISGETGAEPPWLRDLPIPHALKVEAWERARAARALRQGHGDGDDG